MRRLFLYGVHGWEEFVRFSDTTRAIQPLQVIAKQVAGAKLVPEEPLVSEKEITVGVHPGNTRLDLSAMVASFSVVIGVCHSFSWTTWATISSSWKNPNRISSRRLAMATRCSNVPRFLASPINQCAKEDFPGEAPFLGDAVKCGLYLVPLVALFRFGHIALNFG